ncbi:Gfo/Idh/MocA family protein [Microbacterium hominis]|uniref:Gfo/Idh/MocA family oxidoreductase n=1 Tax=Microbacterium hominis TaxID=162426 RepID=A0A7D4PKJ2_9MICO|nr:Gfo/Idh/MocA family oxidoreductase [Microbacterium hominis]QKJ18175.1 Gfo/Idh/MocA family oxidoreductase [Microbacterium hominis]
MTAPLRVAVIGLGDISTVHLAAIADSADAVLVGVCDPDDVRRDAVATAAGVEGYADHRDLLDRAAPDVVHICTPHFTHSDIAVDALERGVNVILEKPLAATRDEGQRVVDAAATSTARIAVCFQNRYNTAVQRAKEILDSGELGAVRGAWATVLWHRSPDYYRASPWRGTWAGGGGGLLMNQAIHTVDLVQWLVGEVTHVAGSAGTRALGDTIEVEDTADLVLTHANGARSVLFATVAHIDNEPVAIEITAEHGRLILKGDLEIIRADGSREIVSEDAMGTGERAYWGGAHVRLITDFHRSLGEPGPFWIDAAAAQKSLEIIQDVYDQSFPHRRVPAPASHEWSTTS